MNPNSYYNSQNELLIYTRERLWAALDQGADARQAGLTDLENYREELRENLLASIGLQSGQLSDQLLPDVDAGEIIEDDGLIIEKLLIRPQDWPVIPALLYRQSGYEGARGAVLFLCGHDHLGKANPDYQIACRILAHAGFIVLTIDPPSQGERLFFPDGPPPGEDARFFAPGTTEHSLLGLPALFRGVSSAGFFMHEALAALAYLASRPDVRADQLAVSGNSGAGLQSALLAAICPDIQAVASGTFISSRRSIFDSAVPQDAEQCLPAVRGRAWDHSDLLLLIAPRACLILAAEDDFFPLGGCRRTVSEARAYWQTEAASAPEPAPASASKPVAPLAPGLELFIDEGGHRYSPEMAEAAARFITRTFEAIEPNLAGRSETPRAKNRSLDPARLNCSPSGQIQRDEASSKSWMAVEAEAQAAEEAKLRQAPIAPEDRIAWLHAQVFNGRSPEHTIDFVRHHQERVEHPELGVLKLRYVLWESAEGLHNYGLHVIREIDEDGSRRGAGKLLAARCPLYYRLVEETKAWGDTESLAALAKGRQLFFHVPTASGEIAPLALGGRDANGLFGARNKLSMDLIAAGDSLAAIRVYDVWTLLQAFDKQIDRSEKPSEVVVTADPAYRFYLSLADELSLPARLDPDFPAVSIGDLLPPKCYRPDRLPPYILPGLLAHGWLAGQETRESL